ncbi:MAG: hypothetical protein Q9O24_10595 [Gammaproteobacteria bacterium]|nr:hypothetical protein [Gammaproteobacteria bacterium]
MILKIIPLMVAFAAISVTTSSLQAASLTASHQVLSQQQGTNGFDVTLALTVSNTGATPLSALSLTSMESISFESQLTLLG